MQTRHTIVVVIIAVVPYFYRLYSSTNIKSIFLWKLGDTSIGFILTLSKCSKHFLTTWTSANWKLYPQCDCSPCLELIPIIQSKESHLIGYLTTETCFTELHCTVMWLLLSTGWRGKEDLSGQQHLDSTHVLSQLIATTIDSERKLPANFVNLFS